MAMMEKGQERPAKAAKAKPQQANPPQIKRVVLVASEKGGVGKSVVTRTLVDYLRTHGHRVAAFDADGGVGATLRVLGARNAEGTILDQQNPVEGVGYYNGRLDEERNLLLDAIETGEALYVHDLAGGLLADLTRIVDDGQGLTGLLNAFDVHGYRLTVLHLISPDIGSTQSVKRWLELTVTPEEDATGSSEDESAKFRADHVAVVNLGHRRTAPADFPFWFGFDQGAVRRGGKTREELLKSGGLEVTFPGLPAGTFAKLDSENVPFSRAAEAGLLTITERAHVAKFLADFEAAFNPVFKLLGLP